MKSSGSNTTWVVAVAKGLFQLVDHLPRAIGGQALVGDGGPGDVAAICGPASYADHWDHFADVFMGWALGSSA
jgi:hypothetical protein